MIDARLVLLIAIAIKCICFGSIPDGMQVDEIGSAIDAWSIVNYGTDRYGWSFPVYFINYGGGQSALYTYACAAFVWAFGFSDVTVRLPALIGSILLGVFGMKIVGRVWNDRCGVSSERAQLLFAILYAVAPYCHMAARFGLDCNLLLGVSTMFLYMLIRAVDERRTTLFIASGMAGGLVLYTYAISHAVMPIFLSMTLIYLSIVRRIERRSIVAFAIPIGLIAAPLLIFHAVNAVGADTLQIGSITFNRLPSYRSGEFSLTGVPQHVWLVFKSCFAFDQIDYNTLKNFWTFYPMSAPFGLIGLVNCGAIMVGSIRDKKFDGLSLIVMWFLSMLIVGAFLSGASERPDPANTNKMNGIMFAGMFFVVSGAAFVIGLLNARRKKIFLKVVAALYAAYSIAFYAFYFGSYRPTFIWGFGFEKVIELSAEQDYLPPIVIDTTFLREFDRRNEVYIERRD